MENREKGYIKVTENQITGKIIGEVTGVMEGKEQDIRERLGSIELRVENLERNQERYNKTIEDVDSKVDGVLVKMDGEFSKVVDTSDHIVRQNNMLMKTMLEGTKKSEEQKADLEKLRAESEAELKKARSARVTQIWVILLSSGGLITAVLTGLLSYLN